MNGAVSFLLAWIVLFVILYALAKNKWGHPLIYYGAWLVAILMIVMNGSTIAATLKNTGLGQ